MLRWTNEASFPFLTTECKYNVCFLWQILFETKSLSQYIIHISLYINECITKFPYSTRIQRLSNGNWTQKHTSAKAFAWFSLEKMPADFIFISNQFTNTYIYKSTEGKKKSKDKADNIRHATINDATVSHNEWGEKEKKTHRSQASHPTWISLEVRFAYKISQTSWIVQLSYIPTIYRVAGFFFVWLYLLLEYQCIRMHKP